MITPQLMRACTFGAHTIAQIFSTGINFTIFTYYLLIAKIFNNSSNLLSPTKIANIKILLFISGYNYAVDVGNENTLTAFLFSNLSSRHFNQMF